MLGIFSLSVLVLHETLLVSVLMNGSDSYGRRRKDLELGPHKLLGIRRMDIPESTDKGVVWSDEGSR